MPRVVNLDSYQRSILVNQPSSRRITGRRGLLDFAAFRAQMTQMPVQAGAALTAAQLAMQTLGDMASDSVLSPAEKQAVVQQYRALTGEKASIDAQADRYALSRAAYDAAVTALTTYMGTLGLVDAPDNAATWVTTSTAIAGGTFRANFQAVFDARAQLLDAIDAAAKGLTDGAQTTADQAWNRVNVAELSAIAADMGTITAGKIIFDNGAMVKVTGNGFGPSSNYLEWFGPRPATTPGDIDALLTALTDEFATYYMKTDGSCYFGGALAAGNIVVSGRNTQESGSAYTQAGPFGTLGGERRVVVSFDALFAGPAILFHPVSQLTPDILPTDLAFDGTVQISATITLRKALDAADPASGTVLGSWPIALTYSLSGGTVHPDWGDWTRFSDSGQEPVDWAGAPWKHFESADAPLTGSFTVIDSGDAGHQITYRLTVSNLARTYTPQGANGTVVHPAYRAQTISVTSTEEATGVGGTNPSPRFTAATKPAAAAGWDGRFIILEQVGADDLVQVCLQTSTDTWTWLNITTANNLMSVDGGGNVWSPAGKTLGSDAGIVAPSLDRANAGVLALGGATATEVRLARSGIPASVYSPRSAAFSPLGFVGARCDKRDAHQAVTSGATAIVAWNNAPIDPLACMTGGASAKFTAPIAGWYLVNVSLMIEGLPVGTGRVAAKAYVNGVAYCELGALEQNGTAGCVAYLTLLGLTLIPLAANDYVDIRLTNGTAAGVTVYIWTDPSATWCNFLRIPGS